MRCCYGKEANLMKKPEITAILLHLGPNNWRKKGSSYDWYIDEEDFVYHEEMTCDKEVWTKITNQLPEWGFNTVVIDVSDGVVYDRHPELAIKGSWSKDELRAELDRLRSIGLSPIPKCNFSCGHNAWLKDYAYMVGTPVYNEVCTDVIEELIELFDTPEFFHLGLEEEDAKSLVGENYPVLVIRSAKKKCEDSLVLFNVCRSHGVRPWIWAGAEDVKAFGSEEMFRKYVGTDVLLSTWHYHWLRYNKHMRDKYPVVDYACKFEEWGYEQIPASSSFFWHLSHKDTVRFAKNYISPKSLKGHISTPWMHTTQRKYYTILNDAFTLSNAINDVYSEELDFEE